MMMTMCRLLTLLSILQCYKTRAEVVTSFQDTAVGNEACQASKNDTDGTCPDAEDVAPVGSQCGVWLALSTLPGAGVGMFAGKTFEKGQHMMPAGDHIVPIVDLNIHQEFAFFLWDEYTWDCKHLRCNSLGVDEVNAASPGFGAAANSFMDFINVDEGYAIHSVAQDLHRSKDPGAGAFTYHHSRMSTASKNIAPGQELFVGYGDHWFEGREKLGPIPLKGDHHRAEILYKRFVSKFMRRDQKSGVKKLNILRDMWDTFVINDSWNSRVLAALPPKEDYETMLKVGLLKSKESKMVRSEEWLQERGVCADNLHMDGSTIPQAGNGAFASRFLAKGTAILPIPLIHIADRSVFDMHPLGKDSDKRTTIAVKSGKVLRQLLLNYCLGHAESTMLLSPYGPGFNLVNHNQTLANVRLQWALPRRSNHHPEMLKKNITHFETETSAKVAMELIALRDIQPGEEIFLDYGGEWEEAWQEHLRTWKPVEGADSYMSALELNNRTDRLLTEFEQMKTPYPANAGLKFNMAFETPDNWKPMIEKGLNLDKFWEREYSDGHRDCEILRYKEVDGRILYTAVIPTDDRRKEFELVEEAPREAFYFEDRPYTSDMFLTNAFRHDLRIPDDMFPEAWKNLRSLA